MNVLLLSAGPGTRLRPLTDKMPKCLLPLFANDEPILRYWIDSLIDLDIKDIYTNIFYLRQQFREYKNSLPADIKKRIHLFDEGMFQKTIGEVLNNLEGYLDDKFLVINSDTYIEKEDLIKFVDQAKVNDDRPICIAVEKVENVKRKSDAKIKDGEVIEFIEKPDRDESGYSWAGICLVDKVIFEKYSYEEISKKQLAFGIFQDFRMTAIEIGNVIDIGDSLDVYYKAREKFKGKDLNG